MENARVLILPSFYPTNYAPNTGIFFKEQASAIAKARYKPEILFVESRGWKDFNVKSLRENHFQVKYSLEDSLPTMRLLGWNLLMRTTLGGCFWSFVTNHLFNIYKSRFGLPDIIHAHNSLWAGYAAARLVEQYNLPLCITEHNSAFLTNNIAKSAVPLIKKAYSNADAVISVSHALATSLLPFLSPKTPVVVPNLINSLFFCLPISKRSYVPFTFLGIGNLIPIKGFEVLINAFNLAFHGNPKFLLKIGGSGSELENLVTLCKSLNIIDQVEFLGALSRVGVRDAMWHSNAFVLSSYKETFGIVLLEALSTGLPVIGTMCGGPEDIITAKVGLLTKPGDAHGLAKAMKNICSEHGYQPEDLHAYVEKKYSESAISILIGQVYESILY